MIASRDADPDNTIVYVSACSALTFQIADAARDSHDVFVIFCGLPLGRYLHTYDDDYNDYSCYYYY